MTATVIDVVGAAVAAPTGASPDGWPLADARPTPGELEWYGCGVEHGIEIGRAEYEAELEASWLPMRAFVRRLAASPSWPELCDARGEHERAARARLVLEERGLA